MTPEEIVRALAAANPVSDHDFFSNHCPLCDAQTPNLTHAEDCPWILATTWVLETA